MKLLNLGLLLALGGFTAGLQAKASVAQDTPTAPSPDTVIRGVQINYFYQFEMATRNNAFANFSMLVGGKVDYTGPGPVYVTVYNGGQAYTSPVDPAGNYTVYGYAASNRVTVDAWIPGQPGKTVRLSQEVSAEKK